MPCRGARCLCPTFRSSAQVALRASGDYGDRRTLSSSLGEEGRRFQQGKFCQVASSLKMGPICGHYFTCVYSKGSFFPCKREPGCHLPALAVLPITHMVPGRVHFHPTALAGEHLLALPAGCLQPQPHLFPGFLLNQPISSDHL